MPNQRDIANIRPAHQAMEGEGLIIQRPFPVPGLMQVNPFLLLDRFGPKSLAPGEAKGVPSHPHRGFEILTYLISGAMNHTDSAGNFGALKSGDLQWMRTGSGVLHKEMPDPEFLKNGGELHGIQLWVNLPAAHKMDTPEYRDISAQEIPQWISPDNGVTIKILSGSFKASDQVVIGPAKMFLPVNYFHIFLKANSVLEFPVTPGDTAFFYGMSGTGLIGNSKREMGNNEMAMLQDEGDAVKIAAGSDGPIEALYLSAPKIDEPMVRYGPFVMNTQEEIEQTFRDYQQGKFGKLA